MGILGVSGPGAFFVWEEYTKDKIKKILNYFLFTMIPEIDKRAICIVDKDKQDLAAVISSYFNLQNSYFSIFGFPPDIQVDDFDGDFFEDDDYIARAASSEAGIFIGNAIARIGGCELIILAGLNDHQKTYLRFSRGKKVIEIGSIDEVEEKLDPIFGREESLECRKEDLLSGLFLAKKNSKRLMINEGADRIILPDRLNDQGIVVLESGVDVFSVVAVNYAYSINANLSIVASLSEEEKKSAERNIQKWIKTKSHNKLQKVIDKALCRLTGIDFVRYKFATFFTIGFPYSLGIKNIIPCSYVSLSLRPDLFIANSIIFERTERFNSGVVFSPGFFEDEETEEVIDVLKSNGYYIRELKGKGATVGNLDFYAQYFPYDIFHICSHGGEVDGYSVTEEFVDRKGLKHILEYDEVVGFSPVPGKKLIQLHRKVIFKRINGYEWRSKELKKQKYPSYIFEDLRKRIFQQSGKSKATRVHKEEIPTSCAIACSDSIHQGEFRVLASHTSPLIFNNACWSWSEVATYFLAASTRGYIGTLWSIGNSEAVAAARIFYSQLFKGTILEAFFAAENGIKGTGSENIYIFWGVHFSSLSPSRGVEYSKGKVFEDLVKSLSQWTEKAITTRSMEVRRNSMVVADQVFNEILSNFRLGDFEQLKHKYGPLIKKAQSQIDAKLPDVPASVEDMRSLDFPSETRHV